ncbi:hypothetical protein WMY93_008173 [Mugilogobius chulae]|uniref:Tetratricopeptide repeat domain 23 n=1 Tax=Mugilogobius chulae TaxID=88201 RepID=A0AAW0PFJ7_9GOBI
MDQDHCREAEEKLSGITSPAQTTRSQLLLMPPEEKLQHFEASAQAHEDSGQYDACIQDLVRCVALVRLVYGKEHLKEAQAHSRLAKAYLQLKGWAPQALEHVSSARQILVLGSGDRLELKLCLLSLCLTQGAAALITHKYPFERERGLGWTVLDLCTAAEAESAFLQAEQILGPLAESGALLQEHRCDTELEICTGLTRVYRSQGQLEQALSRCERSLQLLKDLEQPERSWCVYRNMGHIQEEQGHVEEAVQLLSKAHSMLLTRTLPEEKEGAGLSHSLALLLSTSAHGQDKERAEDYFEQSLTLYRTSVGEKDQAYLTAQDDYCRFLLLRGQQERCAELLGASLPSKRALFGEMSAEVADTLQLLGSVEMSLGQMSRAYRSMRQTHKFHLC